jgi:hypothetical protein
VSTGKGKSCNVSDISRGNRIVTERMVKGEYLCLFVRLLHCINSDKFVLSNRSHEMYHTSGNFRIVTIIPDVNII